MGTREDVLSPPPPHTHTHTHTAPAPQIDPAVDSPIQPPRPSSTSSRRSLSRRACLRLQPSRMAVWSSQSAGFAKSDGDEKRRVTKILDSSQPVLEAQGKPPTILNPQGQQLRVMVVGGGPVRLMAGLQLVQRGAHVDIFENNVGELESLRKQIIYLRPLSVDLIKSVPGLEALMNLHVAVGLRSTSGSSSAIGIQNSTASAGWRAARLSYPFTSCRAR
jgi:hypothetical protein